MTSNYNTIEVEAEEIEFKNERSHTIYFAFIIHYITLTNYYIVIEITSNYSTIEVETGEIEYQNVNFTFSILRISTTLYHTYQLLYSTGHIQMTSNYTTMEIKQKK